MGLVYRVEKRPLYLVLCPLTWTPPCWVVQALVCTLRVPGCEHSSHSTARVCAPGVLLGVVVGQSGDAHGREGAVKGWSGQRCPRVSAAGLFRLALLRGQQDILTSTRCCGVHRDGDTSRCAHLQQKGTGNRLSAWTSHGTARSPVLWDLSTSEPWCRGARPPPGWGHCIG